MRNRPARTKREPTIALINVVFLMLIFLIAGTVAPSLDQDLTLAQAKNLDITAPPDGLVVLPNGSLFSGGSPGDAVADYVATLDAAERDTGRIIPDQALPAAELLLTGAALRAGGVETVLIATERSLE